MKEETITLCNIHVNSPVDMLNIVSKIFHCIPVAKCEWGYSLPGTFGYFLGTLFLILGGGQKVLLVPSGVRPGMLPSGLPCPGQSVQHARPVHVRTLPSQAFLGRTQARLWVGSKSTMHSKYCDFISLSTLSLSSPVSLCLCYT